MATSTSLITSATPAFNPTPITGNYSIVEAQYPIVGGVGGHDLLVLMGPNGAIAELDGFATTQGANPSPQNIGFFSSDLKVWQTTGGTTGNYSSTETQATVTAGLYQTVLAQWNAAISCGAAINSENLPYLLTIAQN